MLITAVALHAAGYCSLTVKIETPSGKDAEARVVVEDQNGWKTERTTRRGIASFCGLGISPVSVTVGDIACNQVVVHNVPLDWNITRNVKITYDEAPCLVDSPPVAACAFFLRFVAANHDTVRGISFKEETPFVDLHPGDEYGRVFVKIAAGQQLSGAGEARGYKPAHISIPCVSKNQRLEQVVVMEESHP